MEVIEDLVGPVAPPKPAEKPASPEMHEPNRAEQRGPEIAAPKPPNLPERKAPAPAAAPDAAPKAQSLPVRPPPLPAVRPPPLPKAPVLGPVPNAPNPALVMDTASTAAL